ncbi:hypothetical protein C7212DRAFT_347493 [Tuber magnatum]|uniref:Uncharacterized protein n=1 Tax=Tuber magnatum TaxID=42249 RepID=A0A317SF25_9PEZI|nr:hypothetical protein C7212DRAFT_347493 [Tuber magnatum]
MEDPRAVECRDFHVIEDNIVEGWERWYVQCPTQQAQGGSEWQNPNIHDKEEVDHILSLGMGRSDRAIGRLPYGHGQRPYDSPLPDGSTHGPHQHVITAEGRALLFSMYRSSSGAYFEQFEDAFLFLTNTPRDFPFNSSTLSFGFYFSTSSFTFDLSPFLPAVGKSARALGIHCPNQSRLLEGPLLVNSNNPDGEQLVEVPGPHVGFATWIGALAFTPEIGEDLEEIHLSQVSQTGERSAVESRHLRGRWPGRILEDEWFKPKYPSVLISKLWEFTSGETCYQHLVENADLIGNSKRPWSPGPGVSSCRGPPITYRDPVRSGIQDNDRALLTASPGPQGQMGCQKVFGPAYIRGPLRVQNYTTRKWLGHSQS